MSLSRRKLIGIAHWKRTLMHTTFIDFGCTPYRFFDEKWWNTFRRKKKVYRRSTSPTIYNHPPTYAPRAMFIAVMSRDTRQGKVGIWPVAEQRQYQRNSRYHQRGDLFWRTLSCDDDIFAVCWITKYVRLANETVYGYCKWITQDLMLLTILMLR